MSELYVDLEPRQEKVLSVFDFDGTLTRHDSFVPFLRFAFGRWEFTKRIVTLGWPSLMHLIGRISRDELKGRLIKTFLTGKTPEWVTEKAGEFREGVWGKLMRPAGLQSVAHELQSSHIVTLCSASPALVLKPFAERLGVSLIATELEVVDGKLTGAIAGNNCRCNFKVVKLEGVYGPLANYRIRAWGDTRGDHELLAAAHDAHWRLFHPAWRRGRYKGQQRAG